MKALRIAVVGAGPAGCAAASRLRAQGQEVILFEKASAPGGRILTHRSDGFALDTGAGFVTNFYPRFFSLVRELGLRSAMRELHRVTGLHHEGRTARLNVSSALSFLRFPFLPMGDKLRMAAWMAGLTLQRWRYDLVEPASLRSQDQLSVGDYARRRLNGQIYDYLIRPGIEPFWYFSCEEVSASLLLALSAQAAGAKFYSVVGGIDQICQELVAGVDLRCSTEVLALEAQPGGLRVKLRGPDGESSCEVDRVVLASTASVAARLCTGLPQSMVSDRQREFLQSQRYAANIHAAFRIPRLAREPGMSAIFPCGPGRHPTAALSFHRHGVSKPEEAREELVSLYLSDPESRRMMGASDEELYGHCLELARALYPALPADAAPFHLVRRAEAIPVHGVGRYRLADDFQQEQRSQQGPLRFCGDYLATATVEGALATGMAID